MRCCGTSHQHHVRLGYLAIIGLSVSFGLVFLYHGETIMRPLEGFGFSNPYLDCHGSTRQVCFGLTSIYRESFSLAIFFLSMSLLCLRGSPVASLINRRLNLGSCWPLKVLLIGSLFVTTFFIPSPLFVLPIQTAYEQFARYASIFYLVLQLCILADFSYTWSDRWVLSYERSNCTNYQHCLLFFFAGIFWVAALVVTVLNFYWFTKDEGCSTQVFLISFTLALGVVYTFLSLTNFVEHGCKG
jgi:serine incorporator 1/3